MSKQHQLKELIIRYQQGKCSESEKQQLRAMIQEEEDPRLLEEVYDILPEDFLDEKLYLRKRAIYQQILDDDRVRSHTESSSVAAPAPWWRKPWAAVAAIALIAMIPFLYDKLSFFYTTDSTADSKAFQEYAIVPGGDKARIVLDDGTTVHLEEIVGDTVIVQNGFSIVKDSKGAIYYRYDDLEVLAGTNMHNTVVTPKGGQYQVVLPDSTRVWLNAESKLKYPVYFGADKREVVLEGEGYFEVAKQTIHGKRIPFIVLSNNQQLEVLGTAFNIQAYGQAMTTTLVEGKVRLGLENAADEVVLQADDQAILQAGTTSFDVQKVDPEYATAWKDGKFSFRKANIQEVMEAMARWYDVDIVYETTIENSFFTGTISRFEEIDKLLEFIALTGSVRFTIEGRRVIVEE